AHAEFMVVKNQYEGETDRKAERGALCYQIRQAFPQGEVTAEEANHIGYETAMRWTKGKYQFFVCTHIDKDHIHNHNHDMSTLILPVYRRRRGPFRKRNACRRQRRS
ncbi:MAG: relaxase/mobilization nuclease domain-containing protein, partial [Clostridiales bacterium]|nr:relaxase/mobilization nuclease domain-containing protein [Clostridiales bacterium]